MAVIECPLGAGHRDSHLSLQTSTPRSLLDEESQVPPGPLSHNQHLPEP